MSKKSAGRSANDLDMEFRDPQGINSHVQVEFEDNLAEPPGAHSIDCIWRCSFRCYECWKNCWYRTLTLFCGCCIAAFWGCSFAQLACCHVWCCTPCFKCHEMNLKVTRICTAETFDSTLGTFCTAFSNLFSKIRLQQN